MVEPADLQPSGTPPSVGVFWFVPGDNGSQILCDLTPLDQAEPYGDMLTHDRGHAEFWDYLVAAGASRLRVAGLSTIPVAHEYDEFPRGRVVFDIRQRRFVGYADQRLQSKAFRIVIVQTFGLQGLAVAWSTDAHYARSKPVHLPA